mmetsp:Transcript_3599/g.5317  ORF Transcript_3599/g.5317 Transcript_3599/m.5317 type:complete len:185 (-) Transcript_3599:162-716(-)
MMVPILRRKDLLAKHQPWISLLFFVEVITKILTTSLINLKGLLFVVRTIIWGAWAAILTCRFLCCYQAVWSHLDYFPDWQNFSCLFFNRLVGFYRTLHQHCALFVRWDHANTLQGYYQNFIRAIPNFHDYLNWFASFAQNDIQSDDQISSSPPISFVMDRETEIFAVAKGDVSFTSEYQCKKEA